MATLLSLPNELLCEIIHLVPRPNATCLAITCHHLLDIFQRAPFLLQQLALLEPVSPVAPRHHPPCASLAVDHRQDARNSLRITHRATKTAFLRLLAHDMAGYIFCQWCAIFHPLRAPDDEGAGCAANDARGPNSTRGTVPRTMKVSEKGWRNGFHRPRVGCRDCGPAPVLFPERWHYHQLDLVAVMARVQYGPQHGLPLSVLEVSTPWEEEEEEGAVSELGVKYAKFDTQPLVLEHGDGNKTKTKHLALHVSRRVVMDMAVLDKILDDTHDGGAQGVTCTGNSKRKEASPRAAPRPLVAGRVPLCGHSPALVLDGWVRSAISRVDRKENKAAGASANASKTPSQLWAWLRESILSESSRPDKARRKAEQISKRMDKTVPGECIARSRCFGCIQCPTQYQHAVHLHRRDGETVVEVVVDVWQNLGRCQGWVDAGWVDCWYGGRFLRGRLGDFAESTYDPGDFEAVPSVSEEERGMFRTKPGESKMDWSLFQSSTVLRP